MEERKVLEGIFILAVAGFLWFSRVINPVATALLIPVLGIILGVLKVKSAFSEFAHPVIFLFISGFVFAGAFEKYGISKTIAEKVIDKAKGRFIWVSVFTFMATAFLSMFMSNTSVTALMLPFAMGIISNLKKCRERNSEFLLLGIAYSASIGGTATLIGTPPNAIAGGILGITFSEWIKFALPTSIILLLTMISMLYILISPCKTKIEVEGKLGDGKTPYGREMKNVFESEVQEMNVGGEDGKTSGEVKKYRVGKYEGEKYKGKGEYEGNTRFQVWKKNAVIFIFTAVCFLWIFGDRISGKIGIQTDFDSIVGIAGVILLFIFRLISVEDFVKSVSWGTIMLFGGGLTLSKVLVESGSGDIISGKIVDIVYGIHPFLLVFGIVLFAIFMTEIMSNTALASLLLPILFSSSKSLGINPESIVIPSTIAVSCAFMLPISTPPNAIVFGTGFVSQKNMMKVGIVLNILLALELAILSYLFFF